MTAADGYRIFAHDPRVARWAQAALPVARQIAMRPEMRGPDNLRHGQTWFVGVDALPNGLDGAIGGVPLAGPWQVHVPKLPMHPAQLSIIYAGYPVQDPGESDANHRYRRDRAAAHVDGLLPLGPERRRFALEYHAYILALPLNAAAGSPTVLWPGSHRIMQRAIAARIGNQDPGEVDITEAYQAARRTVFDSCAPVPLEIKPGESALLHPFVLHGTSTWGDAPDAGAEGRMIAFFRPPVAGGAAEWLGAPDL